MPDFDAQSEIASLRAMLSDVTSQVSRLATPTVESSETVDAPQTGAQVPFYWHVTHCQGLTLTTGAGLDWDPLFDNKAATNWFTFLHPAGSGTYDCGNLGVAYQKRLVVTWDAANAWDATFVTAGLSVYTADSDGFMQIKLNGKMTEYGSSTPLNPISLPIVKGRNRLAISIGTAPDTFQVKGTLWDETRGDSWVDPRTIQGYIR